MSPELQREYDRTLRFLDATFAHTGVTPEEALLAYSGGKDALALATILTTEYGVPRAVADVSLCFRLQHEDLAWTADELGLDLHVVERMDLEWLRRNDHYLFPTDWTLTAKFIRLRQITTVDARAAELGATLTMFGRRDSENMVPAPLYLHKRHALWRACPLKYWSTAHVWEYISAAGWPSGALRIYDTPYGRNNHNGPWNIIHTPLTPGEPWREVYDTEPDLVREAAGVLTSARDFLDTHNLW